MAPLRLRSCDPEAVGQLVRVLRQPDKVALVPTETVYGLVGKVADSGVRERIVQLKHRDPAKHLGWFVPDLLQLERYGVEISPFAAELIRRYTPGPLTIIARRKDGGTVGFRIPDHPLLLAALRELQQPLYQTSANRSGFPNADTCDGAVEMLNGEPDIIIDGGALPPDALASTIVDCTGDRPAVIRQGALNIEPLLERFTEF